VIVGEDARKFVPIGRRRPRSRRWVLRRSGTGSFYCWTKYIEVGGVGRLRMLMAIMERGFSRLQVCSTCWPHSMPTKAARGRKA